MEANILSIIWDFLIVEAYGVVIALWIFGTALKKTPKVQDWMIVYILILLGIIFTMFLLGPTVDALLQGIIAAGVAVLGHQSLVQARDRFFPKEE